MSKKKGPPETEIKRRKVSLDGVVEAPCYYPSVEEFREPLKYIAHIRSEAERYGICRISPPQGWKPPFAHKPDKLRFHTKQQDLGRLVGAQRLTRDFTENLRKFLFLIGKPMDSLMSGKVTLDKGGGKPVGLFMLFKHVGNMGGVSAVDAAKTRWDKVATLMGFQSMGKQLKEVYARYLKDFESVRANGHLVGGAKGGFNPVVNKEKESVQAPLR
ncbi:unnamed protein product [Choristocarpus tenellus]